MPVTRIPLALLAGLSLAAGAHGAVVGGVSVPDSTRVGPRTLVLQGAAVRSKLLFKVYVGALYLPEKRSEAPGILAADEPRRMELRFLRDVGADALCAGWKEAAAANVPGPTAGLAADFDRLCAWVPDVAEGSVIALTYLPGNGTTLEVDGLAKGTVAGKPFADALLAGWLGPRPAPGVEFKNALLKV
jgi:hypothetical protein